MRPEIRQYLLVTGNYWAFTLTDGALRMLVVLHFYSLGYGALDIALMFLFYEFFGVVTNLVGGWLGARVGLNRTMNIGLALQIAALGMLLVPAEWLTVIWVMMAQALSGIAKDLNKMSAKSSIKGLVVDGTLFKWVAALTGSKNALKGLGFFLGAGSLALFGFQATIAGMAGLLTLVWVFSLITLPNAMGKASAKPKFSEVFSSDPLINRLSAARTFLFGARDVWFVVALPVFLAESLNWEHWQTGTLMASWVIGYGAVQGFAPKLIRGQPRLFALGLPLIAMPVVIALCVYYSLSLPLTLIAGLVVFGVLFALNSSVHSYLIVHYARQDGVSLDVGFYYMANAMGRLIGTLLSGYVYQVYGLVECLLISALMLGLATWIAAPLDRLNRDSSATSQ